MYAKCALGSGHHFQHNLEWTEKRKQNYKLDIQFERHQKFIKLAILIIISCEKCKLLHVRSSFLFWQKKKNCMSSTSGFFTSFLLKKRIVATTQIVCRIGYWIRTFLRNCSRLLPAAQGTNLDLCYELLSERPQETNNKFHKKIQPSSSKRSLHSYVCVIGLFWNRRFALGKGLTSGKWMPYKLSTVAFANRLHICMTLFVQQKKKIIFP